MLLDTEERDNYYLLLTKLQKILITSNMATIAIIVYKPPSQKIPFLYILHETKAEIAIEATNAGAVFLKNFDNAIYEIIKTSTVIAILTLSILVKYELLTI